MPNCDDEAPAPETEFIRLDQFLKFVGFAATGGHAKRLIQGGEVQVNGEVETRRSRKLRAGDLIAVSGSELSVSDYLDR